MSDKTLVNENREKAGAVQISFASDLTSKILFADGVHGIGLRGGVAHIDLYQVLVQEGEGRPEQRVVSQRLVLSLPAAAELSKALSSMGAAIQKAAKLRQEKNKIST